MEETLGLNPTVLLDEPPPQIAEALELMIGRVAENSDNWYWYTNWEIVLKEENRIIGGCSFYGNPDEKGNIEIAYIIQEAYRRRGFAKEAVSSLISFAFSFDNVKSVIVTVEKDNKKGGLFAEKLGFLECGKDSEKNTVWQLKNEKNKR